MGGGDMHALREQLALHAVASRPPAIPTLIFAGSLQRAAAVATERRLRRGEWRFVQRLSDLQGYSEATVVVLITESWYRIGAQSAARSAEQRDVLLRLRTAKVTHEYVGGL